MILYHAISSYQILAVILHKLIFHKKQKSILILPDFIVEKYPQYIDLVKLKIFDEIYLFPYLYIQHNLDAVLADTIDSYNKTIPYDIHSFSEVFVAGAHFYFSLYLISQNISFSFFEDAIGMLSQPNVLYTNLSKGFPIHAKIAMENGLFSGNNKLIKKIYCLKEAQTIDVSDEKYIEFNIMRLLKQAGIFNRSKIIKFFLDKKYNIPQNSILLLTQHFACLGIMSKEEQFNLYVRIRDKYFLGKSLVIKQHPDDTIDYSKIFPTAIIIQEKFPSELLPYVFNRKPIEVVTISSTASKPLEKCFNVRYLNNELQKDR